MKECCSRVRSKGTHTWRKIYSNTRGYLMLGNKRGKSPKSPWSLVCNETKVRIKQLLFGPNGSPEWYHITLKGGTFGVASTFLHQTWNHIAHASEVSHHSPEWPSIRPNEALLALSSMIWSLQRRETSSICSSKTPFTQMGDKWLGFLLEMCLWSAGRSFKLARLLGATWNDLRGFDIDWSV